MLSSIHVVPGVDPVTGAFALSMFVAGAAVAVAVVLGVAAFRRSGELGTSRALWRGALVLVGAILAWTLFDRSSIRDEFAAERRAVEVRAAELTMRAIEPGSALACLDAVAGAAVETACEKALFASPEAVAAAAAYVDARISLLIASVKLAERDPDYRASVERLRRAIEADRFGLVGHVLTTRGCNGGDCVELKHLHNTTRILANMKARAYEAKVKVHAAAWHPAGAAVIAAAPAPVPALAAMPQPVPMAAPTTTTGTAASAPSMTKFDFPSAASIPPVSIMNAEPEGSPPEAEPAAKPHTAAPPPKRAPAQASRRQSAREPAPQPSPPLSVVPQAASPSWPQIGGSR